MEQDVTLSHAEVQQMTERYGERMLQMGTLNEDGSLSIPVECILEAAKTLGSRRLADAVDALRSEKIVPMLESVESLVERVSEAKKRRIVELTRAVQNAPTETEAKEHWQKLEHLMFGI